MKNLYADTNAIVSYITGRNKEQATLFKSLLLEVKQGVATLTIIPEVVVETVYVLEQRYKTEKYHACDLIQSFLASNLVTLENREVIMQSLEVYKLNNLEFLDVYLYFEAKSKNAEVFSFDRDLERLRKRY